jgi:hypothetical protein
MIAVVIDSLSALAYLRLARRERNRIHTGLDLAFAPENTAVYVQVGSAWAHP